MSADSRLEPLSAKIVDQVRADLIVHALLDDAGKSKTFWEWPSVKLLAPFILTTVVGTWLAITWQTRQWTEQQKYTAIQEAAKTRLDLVATVTQKVGETFASGEDILILYQVNRKAEMQKHVSQWLEQNRAWRVEEKVLAAEIEANFSDPEIARDYDALRNQRRKLFFTINDFLQLASGKNTAGQQARLTQLNNTALTIIRDTTSSNGLLVRLSKRMLQETREKPRQ